jgi:hypothetical protein
MQHAIAPHVTEPTKGVEMLCALTVRKLTPGALEAFQKAFIPAAAPPGWTRFYALRNVDDEDEVITFGFFDGTAEELRASHQQDAGDSEDRRRVADELVKSVGANGVYEVLEERSRA